jgi:hypothetical protein
VWKEEAMSDTVSGDAGEPTITIDTILAAIDETWQRLDRVLARLEPALSTKPDAGGWTVRDLLSHLAGAWQRVPVHAGFFLANRPEVPIQVGDRYWIAEWETAPLGAFTLAMRTSYEGNRAFVRGLDPAMLSRKAQTPFGEMTLGELLVTSYRAHIGNFHIPQLEAFLAR